MDRIVRAALRIAHSPKGKMPLEGDLAHAFAEIVAAHWVSSNCVTYQTNGAIRIDPSARRAASQLSKRLAWMDDGGRHHLGSQQVQQCGEKTVRGLLARRISYSQLGDQCVRYSRLRGDQRRKNKKRAPLVSSFELRLENHPGVARRLVSKADLEYAGRSLGNCLQNRELIDENVRAIAAGSREFIAMIGATKKIGALVEAEGAFVTQAKGAANSRPIEWRDGVLELLSKRGLRVDECCDLLDMGICDELLDARATGNTRSFDWEAWSIEIGPGFAVWVSGERTRLIRSQPCPAFSVWSMGGGECGAGPIDEMEARVLFRRVCRNMPEFNAACARAFRDAPRAFREDLGIQLPSGRSHPPSLRIRPPRKVG